MRVPYAEESKYSRQLSLDRAMKAYPAVPHVDDAPPKLFDGGHLWIQEKIDGGHCRFQLSESGVIQMGDRTRVFDPGDIPAPYGHAVRHVRERLDREALRNAVDRVDDIVFFGESTHKRAIEYDWSRIPSFLGYDIWSESDEAFLPPDAAEKIFAQLGLTPVNTFQKEVRAADFDPDAFEIPRSRWYDGPSEGVVLRNKTGLRAQLLHPEFQALDDPVSIESIGKEQAREWATERRLETIANSLEDRGKPVTYDALYDRVLEAIMREKHPESLEGYTEREMQAFRSEVGARAREFVSRRR